MRSKLTIDRARDMDFQELVEEADLLVEQFARPQGATETQEQQFARLSDTLDAMPDIYRWFLTLQSYFDHWTDAYADQFNRQSKEYKGMRQRRDAMDRAASAAKRRYEGASRLVTLLTGFDESGMPRARNAARD